MSDADACVSETSLELSETKKSVRSNDRRPGEVAWRSLIIGTFTDYTNMGRLFSRNFSRRYDDARDPRRRRTPIERVPPAATGRYREGRKCTKAHFYFPRDESRALLPVFDTGNREKPRWKRRFPMTQLVCRGDRTPNRAAALFPHSSEVARARTADVQIVCAIRDKKGMKLSTNDLSSTAIVVVVVEKPIFPEPA